MSGLQPYGAFGGVAPWLVPSAHRIEFDEPDHLPWPEFQLRPAISGATTASATSATGLSWTHTSEAGKSVYVIVWCNGNLFNEPATKETGTFNGLAMTKHVRWAGSGAGFMGCVGFSLVSPPVGAFTLAIDGVDTTNYVGVAFNVANGPRDGCMLLPGAYAAGGGSMTRTAIAWDPNGLQLASAFIGLNAGATLTMSGGTTIVTGNGMVVASASANDDEVSFTATRSNGSGFGMMTFLIPASNQILSGGAYQLWFQSRHDISSLAVGSSTVLGLPYSGGTGEGRLGTIIPVPGTIRSIAIETSVAPGAGDAITAELMIGGQADATADIGQMQMIPTGITATISGTATSTTLDDIDLLLYRYQRVGLRYTNSGATGLPAGLTVRSTMLFESGTGDQVYGGGRMEAGVTSTYDLAFRRGILHPDGATPMSTFPDSEKSLIGIDCEVRELVVNYQAAVTVNPDHDYYLEKNGVLQDGSGGTVDTRCTLITNTMGQSCARWRGTLSLSPGDFLSVVGYARTGAAFLRQVYTIRVRPSTAGEMLLSGHSTVTSTVDYVAMPNAARSESTTTTANESTYSLLIPPMPAASPTFTAGGLREVLEAAGPGASKSLITTVRKELVNTLISLTLSGSTTSGVTGNSATFSSGEHLSLYFDAVNSPSLTRQFWTIPGYIRPPGGGLIGPLAWIHWPRRIPTSPAETLTDSYTDHPGGMQCPAIWENGFKEDLITSFGDVERPASHLFTGDWQGSTFQFQIADKEGRFRAQQASLVDRYWNDALTVRMTTRANRAEYGQAFTVFNGPIVEAQPTASLLWDVTLGDVVKQGLLSDKVQIPWRTIRDSFLSQLEAVSETLDRDRPEPIYYGAHTEVPGQTTSPATVAGFRVKPIYFGIQNIGGHDRHVWMVCGHAVKAISIYVDGVETPEDPFPGFGETWWIPGHGEWMDFFGVPFADLISDTYGTFRRYTLIYGRVGRDGPDDCAIGDRELTASVLGVEDIGDGTGELITDRFQQYEHFLINYVANQGPQSYQFGEWLQNPTWNIFDGDVTKVDEDSFDTATELGETRLVGGYIGVASIGAGAGDRASAKAWIADWNRSCGCRFGINHQGQMHIFLLSPTQAIKDAAPLYTDAYEILDGSFSTELKFDEQATAISYKADYEETSGEWKTSGVERDEDASENYGEEIVSEPREYPFAPGEDQARHLAILELRIRKHKPRYIRLDATVGPDPVTEDSLGYRDQGDYIRYVHFDAVQETREERLAQIITPIVRVGSRRVACIAMDCEDLIDYDVDSSPSP